MKIKGTSVYKNPAAAKAFLENWNYQIQLLNNCFYKKINVSTSLGNTVVCGYNTPITSAEAIVIFPGFRTCGLFWDFDNYLLPLKKNYRIFLIEINGQSAGDKIPLPEYRLQNFHVRIDCCSICFWIEFLFGSVKGKTSNVKLQK